MCLSWCISKDALATSNRNRLWGSLICKGMQSVKQCTIRAQDGEDMGSFQDAIFISHEG